jgi:hypothetical protein
MEDTKIVPRDRVDDWLSPVPAFTEPRVAAIAFGPRVERPRNVATVTVVTMAGAVFLVTAKHVIESDVARELPWRLLVPPRYSATPSVDRRPGPPLVFPLCAADVLWSSPSTDVAVLRSPEGLNMAAFDGDRAVKPARRARETWDAAAADDAYFMVVVSGFPSFARDDADQPLYGLMSLPGFIVHANRPDPQIEAPRLVVNLGCEKMKPEWSSVPEAVTFARRLSEDLDGRALAGMSGGSVVAVSDSGYTSSGYFTREIAPWRPGSQCRGM